MKTKDIQEIIKIADEFYAEYNNSDKHEQKWAVFRALVALTSDLIEADKPDECYFTYDEIAQQLLQNGDNSPGAKRIGQHLTLIKKQLLELTPLLSDIAKRLNLSSIPDISIDTGKGGRGNKSRVRLLPRQIDEKLERTVSTTTIKNENLNSIRYTVESAPPFPIWARWIQRLTSDKSHSTRLVILTLSPILIAVFLCFQFLLLIAGVNPFIPPIINTALIVYIVMFIAFFQYLFTAINNNIALLPAWTLPLRLRAAVLEYELSNIQDEKDRIKSPKIKVYTASCPTCGHRVYLDNPVFWQTNKIIGKCDRNPIEHRYSFDFTTLEGIRITN